MDEGDPGGGPWRPRGDALCGPSVHHLDWGQLWAYGRVDLGLSDREFWKLTLYELDLLSIQHRHRQEREDRRAAMGAWVLANVNRDSKQRSEPFTLDEVTQWLGYAQTYVARAQAVVAESPPTPDELKRRLEMVHLLHKGLYGENGQQEEG